MRSLTGASLLIAVCALPTMASAQVISTNTPTTDASIAFTYDKGRNESVLQRERPDYAPLGIRAGGFLILPSVETRVGFTDNAYQIQSNKQSDGFVQLTPVVQVNSTWSVHSVKLEAGGDFIRYFDATPRDQDAWHVSGDGRLNVSSDLDLNLGLRTERQYESRFSGTAQNNISTVTPYQQTLGRFLGEYRFARIKATLAGDYAVYRFSPVTTFDGARLSQRNRDRHVVRVTGQAEYGITPDAGAFVQVGYADTEYRTALAPGVENRDSHEVRVLAGITADLTSLLRGSIGIGYVDRNYLASPFADIHGFSVDGRIEYFFTSLTTISLAVRREVDDSNFGGSGYLNTSAALRVDHELLRNLLLNVGIEYEKDDYRGVVGDADVVRLGGGARYFVDRLFGLDFNLVYGRRDSDFVANGPQLSEFRATAGVTVHR